MSQKGLGRADILTNKKHIQNLQAKNALTEMNKGFSFSRTKTIYMDCLANIVKKRVKVKSYFFNESEQRFPVIQPFLLKLRSWWVFATGKFKCDLKAVSPKIVIILHST